MNTPNLMADHVKMIQRLKEMDRLVARLTDLVERIEAAAPDEKRAPGRPRKEAA
jgi:hypothetical protein